VFGGVKREMEISMTELISRFESVSFPVLLVCAGNRRREQNMHKQSKGFNWGAAGLSNAIWTGVRLRDVLVEAGLEVGVSEGHVRFTGELLCVTNLRACGLTRCAL
jgi:nitrate reductase (NAD(P)H)